MRKIIIPEALVCKVYRGCKNIRETARAFNVGRDTIRRILIDHGELAHFSPNKEKPQTLPPVGKASANEGNPMEMAKIMLAEHFYRKQGMIFYKGERIRGIKCWRERIIPDLNELLIKNKMKPVVWKL